MQLYYSPTSPYARKVRIMLMESGLIDRVNLITADGWDPQTPLNRINPLSQVPTLVLGDGEILYDSSVICEYLDNIHDVIPFIPADQLHRLRVLRTQALADGIMAASVAIFLERKREPDMQSEEWIGFQQAAIGRGLDAINKDMDLLAHFDLGSISLLCALGHIDFRNTYDNWRSGRDELAEWYEQMLKRHSVQQTIPEKS